MIIVTKTYWIIPCNLGNYEVISAYKTLDIVDWKQSSNLKSAKIDDIVFIYLTSPMQSIKYMCRIKKVNKPYSTIDDKQFMIDGQPYINYGNYMELELLSDFENESIHLTSLKEHGMKGNIQGPRRVYDELLDFILNRHEKVNNTNILGNTVYREGKPYIQYGVKYERNFKLRQKAIEIHGLQCKVCGFDFQKRYGDLGRNFIEVHHTRPMYQVGKEIKVNPETDLVPLCANCHRMVHRKKQQPLKIEELKRLYKSLNE